jgi:DNA-binding transcriptional MocR family regulator
MVDALHSSFSKEICQFTVPKGGMFIFLTFPTLKMSSHQLFETLTKYQLICVAGDEFFVSPVTNESLEAEEKGKNISESSSKHEHRIPTLRLTYAAATPDQMKFGIDKLSKCIHDLLKK